MNMSSVRRGSHEGSSNKGICYKIVILVCVAVCGIAHSFYVSTLFENNSHFSHLSTLEREMIFRTEMGFYYSYYKTVVESPTFDDAIILIKYDNQTEFPNTINAMQRFNIYPEIVLGFMFRLFKTVLIYFEITAKECWEINRGADLPPVESCIGVGEPIYFYVNAVWSLSSLTTASIFLFGLLLSDSVFGGLFAVANFFYNHSECTRVQWTPSLRESFGYPFIIAQMLAVAFCLKKKESTCCLQILIGILTSCFLISWQFAPFVLLSQTCALYILYVFNFCNGILIKDLLKCFLVAFLTSWVIMFQNDYLLNSFYFSFLVSCYIALQADHWFKKKSSIFKIFQVMFIAACTITIKIFIPKAASHDVHIWNIFKSKISNYKDFHTLMYTCASEFQFMEFETIKKLTETLLIPETGILVIVISFQIFKSFLLGLKSNKNEEVEKKLCKDDVNHAHVVYTTLQLFAFSVMAILIMRLKLFFSPHLCIYTSLLFSRRYFRFLKNNIHVGILVVIIAAASTYGCMNIKRQASNISEYSNMHLEELLEWTKAETPSDAVFAGPISTMANLFLSTRRPIVVHPHYENAELRERVKQVYTIYSRKSPEAVYQILSSMKVNYVVVDRARCHYKNISGCSSVDQWDIEDTANIDNPPVCKKLLLGESPFSLVFRNDEYSILKL